MKLTIAIALWAACGLYSWGTMMADGDYDNHHEFSAMGWGSRHNTGICGVVALTGPLWVIPAAVTTNFNQHGWQLWERR